MNNTKRYLGDSVYADIERGMIKLTTENGMGASDTIFLELEVYDALKGYVGRMIKHYEEKNTNDPEAEADP